MRSDLGQKTEWPQSRSLNTETKCINICNKPLPDITEMNEANSKPYDRKSLKANFRIKDVKNSNYRTMHFTMPQIKL